ncbi:MAG: hypothetical protein NTZ63_06610 [Candidatus Omnitrophica bacterium]|nr:hypothetical protein [Candidatus Omnitrophota bacterium]
MKRKGFALIAIIIIVLFVAIGVLSTTGFIANRFSGFDVDQRLFRCTYAAQAGIQYAIYQYRAAGTLYASGTNVSIGASDTFRITSVSAASNYLLVDATKVALGGGNKQLNTITYKNTSTTTPITIASMNVIWNTASSNLTSILINNVNVFTGSVATPGRNINITDTAIPANTTRSNNRETFSAAMNGGGSTITLQFVMSDGSDTTTCTVWPKPGATCPVTTDLTITSTGKTTGSALYKTYQATYNTSTNKISAYSEIASQVP